ncbi:sensor histidine kinase KdpD [Sphingomonas sp.]|uniref:sensor histidine kinase n=1 Tax=Sphingomonas sp. TaxID=28214 RepID=UPI0025EBA4BC|nr:sensor histidine kinase KdpD [Sphingomonas sp.]
MSDLPRPTPEALLKVAKREARGRLKIFLGAAPGVGKTYEMLREGAEMLRGDTDVVVGFIETHGRPETEALVAPFEVIARRAVTYGAQKLHEFDIDALLARHPTVALVDEFAHSNVPGSRHPKRWQDIEELRDAGINVLTTLNIQHVESLNDVVAGFTRVRVRETVPDAMLDDAEIEIVDLPPDELIERLKDGKVYVPHEASRALGHFFSKSNLSALRELALRRAAQAIDLQMLDHIRLAGESGNWAAGERVVVAVGDQPGSEALIRATKRLADALRAPWTAVNVETPRTATLGPLSRERMAGALKLAAALGATIVTVPARTVLAGLCAHIIETRATAIVIGKSRRSWWFELRHGSVVDHLVRQLDGVAIHVVPVSDGVPPPEDVAVTRKGSIRGFGGSLGLIALTTALAALMRPFVGANSIDLIYLIPVIATATLFGLRSSLLASFAAALAYNFFFLPPLYTLTISDPGNVVTLLVFVMVGTIASQMTGRLKREATIGARTATENAALAAFGQRLAGVSDGKGTADAVCEEISALLDVSTVLFTSRTSPLQVTSASPHEPSLGPVDIAAAEWAFDQGTVSGRDSETLNASDWQFHPLITALGTLGVLGIARSTSGDPVPTEKRILFSTLIGQAALAHERLKIEANAWEVDALKQRDELRATLLSSLGHDLKTPLTAVVAAANALAVEHGSSQTSDLLQSEARRLRRVFDDLVEMTRLETGALVMKREATDLVDAIASAAQDLRAELATHQLILDVAPNLPFVQADPRMLHHILINLLSNAAKFSPVSGRISVTATRSRNGLRLVVGDEGPGLPLGGENDIFLRFSRVEGDDRSGGTGLGLAIVKGFSDAMGLTVRAANGEDGGARFEIDWPEAMLRRVTPATAQ